MEMASNRILPLLTGYSRYDKTLSTRGRGEGTVITAPILAYLVEGANGRVLYDVGCDFSKVEQPAERQRYYGDFPFGAPEMSAEQRTVAWLERLGLAPADLDMVVCGHLHFDHAGGLCDFRGCDVCVHERELAAARNGADEAYFDGEAQVPVNWRCVTGDRELMPGVRLLETPGHTAGHYSLWIEREQGRPIVLAGDAADLQENLDDEVAPGLCFDEQQALGSIGRLNDLAATEDAWLWPNHDLAFFNGLKAFPQRY